MSVDAPNTVREYFSAELKRLRHRAGLTQQDLAERINYSTALVGMVEKGQRSPTAGFTERCDDVLGADGLLSRLRHLVIQETHPRWFRPFVEMEADAAAIQQFDAQAVPGVLQTEAYARAVLEQSWPPVGSDEVEKRIAARLDRQRLLDRQPPARLWFLLDEAVIARPVGGSDTMHEQFRSLIDSARRPNVRIQVLPFRAGAHAAMDGSFTLIAQPDDATVVYIEGPATARMVADHGLVAQCVQRFDALRACALSPAESTDLLLTRIGEP